MGAPEGEPAGFTLRALQEGDGFGSMQSGGPAFALLKSFARQKAHKYEQLNLARTYVIFDEDEHRIAAYITLVCSEVVSQDPLLEDADYPHDHYPAIKIARLLVDARYRPPQPAHGFGRALVDFALGIARAEICPAVGCRFAVVDSKQDSVAFYERCGFTLVDTADNRGRAQPVMFLDLHKAAK